MKQWITLVAAAAIFASCSKESLEQEAEQQSLTDNTSLQAGSSSRTMDGDVYISGWQQGGSWTNRDSADMRVFTYMASMPQISSEVTTNGAVFTFARIMNAPEGYETYRSPQRLDFAFVPVNARVVKGVYLMRDDVMMQGVKLTYSIPASAESDPTTAHLAPTNFQFQYIVIPGSFLTQNGLTQSDLAGYNYTQLMDLVTPK